MTKSFYETHVSDYQKVTNLWFPRRHQKLISLISVKPQDILDVGCGTGVMLQRIEEKFPGAKYYGVDISKPMINYAKKSHPNYFFKISNAEKLSFKDNRFNLVTSSISFHHYKNPEKSLSEAYRVLKPGGQFILMDITPKHRLFRKINDFGAKYIVRDGHEAFHSLENIENSFQIAGFNKINQHFIGFPGVYITIGYK